MLAGKTALITGACGGLGREISFELAKKGCHLFLVGRDLEKLYVLHEDIKKEHDVSIESKSVDMTIDMEIGYLLSQAGQRIDILVNNAAIFPLKPIADSTNEDFDKCFAVNIRSPFILSRELGRHMCERGWGRIINIGSSSAYNGSAETGVYCASKHALLGLSRSLYQEFKESGVRVYSVSPGSIRTPMGRADTRQDYSTFINPKEIAEYISFIMSYENEMISEEIRLNRMTIR
jgi:short-subunit dehydrogenase